MTTSLCGVGRARCGAARSTPWSYCRGRQPVTLETVGGVGALAEWRTLDDFAAVLAEDRAILPRSRPT